MALNIDLVERVPASSPLSAEVPIIWEEMTRTHVRRWHEHVVPHIKADPRRADIDWWWDWRLLLSALGPWYRRRRRAPVFLTASVIGRAGFVPAAMVMLLTKTRRIDGEQGETTYTSFLTSAPKLALENFGVTALPDMGRALVDCGIVMSYLLNQGGHTWLHCTPIGEDWLLRFYSLKCKLHQFPKGNALPGWRKNDGRHFFTDEALAVTLTRELDMFRPQPLKSR